jgi:hypothetical protein
MLNIYAPNERASEYRKQKSYRTEKDIDRSKIIFDNLNAFSSVMNQ